MANIAVQEAQPNAKRQRTEGGWEEVSVKTEGQWQEVPSVKEDDEWEDAEAAVQDTPGQQVWHYIYDKPLYLRGIVLGHFLKPSKVMCSLLCCFSFS